MKVAVEVVDCAERIEYRREMYSDTSSVDALFEMVFKEYLKMLDENDLAMFDFYGVGTYVPGKVRRVGGITLFQSNIS